MKNQRIGHILKEQGLINDHALDFCLAIQKNNKQERIGKVLKDYDFINDEQMVSALAKQAGWDVYHGSYELAHDMVKLLGIDFMLKHMIFPAKDHGAVVFIMAFSDDMAATDQIQSKLQSKVCFMLDSEAHVRKELEKISLAEPSPDIELVQDDLLFWAEQCFQDAIKQGATDIHIEPSARAVEVRLRIDGILHFYRSFKLDLQKRLVNIIFHKANVTISDFGKFHDARFTYGQGDVMVDVRVSHIPCVHGSSLVMRLLDKNKASIPLVSLGYDPDQWQVIEEKLIKPEGMVLIVGPTGCGKTTTLYAMLNFLKGIERKVLTIEDPVEMHHPLMTQVQMNDKRDISFGNAIRAFLRHDPNIILIGEIRDAITAEEGIRASMTGHKVFATLHAKEGMDAFLRLNDLGVPYTYMASNISMVITQRLVRILCPICKTSNLMELSQVPSYAHKYVIGIDTVWIPRGCSHCYGGYKGRKVVASIIDCNETVQDLLLGGNIPALKDYLKTQGVGEAMSTQVKSMIKEGATSIQEGLRVLG